MYRFDLKKKKKKLKIVLDGLNETKRTLSLFYISTSPLPVHSPSADEAAYTSFLKIINGNDSKKVSELNENYAMSTSRKCGSFKRVQSN